MASLRHFATSPLRHFATSPLRHASQLVTLVLLALACATANAALIVNVEGVRGSGVTTWTLSGSSTSNSSGTVRTGSGSNNYSLGDTLLSRQFLSAKTKVNKNSLFAVTESGRITVGSETRTITHIFLGPYGIKLGDEEPSFFGIRVDSPLRYTKGAGSSWSGRFTLNLDIGNFKPGSYKSPGFGFSGTDTRLNFTENASGPEPSSLALLGLALTGLRFSRKLKGAAFRT